MTRLAYLVRDLAGLAVLVATDPLPDRWRHRGFLTSAWLASPRTLALVREQAEQDRERRR